jgi:hypothetical protein
VTSIETYKKTVEQAAKLVDEYRPDYYVIMKKKKDKKGKKKVTVKTDKVTQEEDFDTSDSDDEHIDVNVVFLTFGKVKTSKDKFRVELSNGTYYLTFAGYVKKATNKNVVYDNRKYANNNQDFSYRVKLFDQVDKKGGKKIIKGNKIHKFKVDKKKGTKVIIKVIEEE